ncbi:MAG TPA: hypothetical protein VKW77_05490, partial [Acidimicrobiales bacterium]|nr:hypothetical protein [Acidimicrobiales bacterium]
MRSTLKLLLAASVLACLGGACLAVARPAGAAGHLLFVATNGSDTSNCQTQTAPCQTISYAVTQAASGDTIRVGAGTFKENVTVPATFSSLTIVGQGASTVVTGTAPAGATFFLNGTVTLQTMSISGYAQDGRGIFDNADGSQFVQDEISGNTGGGIFNNGNGVSITQDLISDNGGPSTGGAIFNNGNNVVVANDTITGNSTPTTGGALFNNGSPVTLTSDTITNNTATSS